MSDEAVQDLARRAGIAVEWHDFAGRPQVVGPDVLRRILAALGLPCETRGDLAASRRELTRNTNLQALPPLVTATAGRPTRLDSGASEPYRARLELEAGGRRDISVLPVRGRLRVPAISEPGYHRLLIEDRDIVLAVAPGRCRTIDDAVPDARLWGLAAQVYSLRQAGDAGIGDAAGIAALAEAAGRGGADALALSPLHALFTADPTRFGPYSPSTRLFLNPLHAAPGLVFGEQHVAQAIAEAGLGDVFARLEALKLIDWPEAAAAKLSLLRVLFEDFTAEPEANGALATDFALFRADGGNLLAQHAAFEALHAEQLGGGTGDWRRWPADLRDPTSATVAVFAASRRDEVLFHIFLQWLADRSLAAAQQRARASGMRVGLISDLAVGMDPTGSHAWSRQGDILGGLTIGAPPDLYNTRGQDWSLTGFSPRALNAGGFAPFLATVRAALRHTGGLRIDHAMGLARLWLIPQGASPADGAYLAYPVADLLRLLALESHRHHAIVVGEDLGTLPYGFHETLETAGVHGMRVMWFEREGQAFAAPDRWDHAAIAMTSTHDLPTVAGWWHGTDIATRAACDRLGNGVSEADAVGERNTDRAALWEAFVRAGVAAGEPPPLVDTRPAVDAAIAFVARTSAPLCLLPVEDVVGLEEQPNLPGTMDEHPNWRRRVPGAAGSILDTPDVAARVANLAAKRPRL
jgi:4-alpha-glucanotransferase